MRLLRNIIFALTVLLSLGCSAGGNEHTQDENDCGDNISSGDCDVSRINSRGWEDSLFVTPDGQELYFTYVPWNFFPFFEGLPPIYTGPVRPGQLPVTGNPFENPTTYVSRRRANGTWGPPVAASFNIPGGVCCAMVTEDRNEVYFQREFSDSSDDIVYLFRQPGGDWSSLIRFGTEINSPFHEGNPQLSADGRTIFFTSDRPGGEGGKDLWFSTKSFGGDWAPAQNLGSAINSGDDEEQPWISQDGNTLLFSRGVSIFQSRKSGGEWTAAEPVRFQQTVEGGEATMTQAGDELYLVVIDRTARDLIVSVSHRLSDELWSTPEPVPQQ